MHMYKILILNNFGILFQAVIAFDPQKTLTNVNFIGPSCSGESCSIAKGWFYDNLNDRVQWLMKVIWVVEFSREG